MPYQPFFQPITPQKNWDENEFVCDLIDDETKEWKWNRLNEMFGSHEVSNISMIYVSKNDLLNELMWYFERKKKAIHG